jgi:hypothetical protein
LTVTRRISSSKKHLKSEENESDVLTKNTTEKILKGDAENLRKGTVMAWRGFPKTVEMAVTAWRETAVKIEESEDDLTDQGPRSADDLLRSTPVCASLSMEAMAVEHDWNRCDLCARA